VRWEREHDRDKRASQSNRRGGHDRADGKRCQRIRAD
jgi:hypothetical protein